MNTWQQYAILLRKDGSYIVMYNGNPYHVPQEGGWVDGTEAVQWPDVHAWALAHPELVEEEPLPPEPDQAELDQIRIAEIQSTLDHVDLWSVRPLRALAEGTALEADTLKLRQLEQQAASLRMEWAELADRVEQSTGIVSARQARSMGGA